MATLGKRSSEHVHSMVSGKKSKRQIFVKTFEKWQGQFDKDYNTLSWLGCVKDRSDRSLVSLILCEICKKYETKICSSKNFSKVC